MLENKLQDYIDQLGEDIKRIRGEEKYTKVRNLVKQSDLRLLEDIKDDLEQLMKGV